MSNTRADLNLEPELITDLINKVKGKSALVQLAKQTPIPFNGTKEYTFNLDKEIDVVAEGGKKTEGGMSFEPITIKPIKVEYGVRFTDEFLYATDEAKISFLQAFNDGFSKKLAKGIDLMAILGINPRTGTPATETIANNYFVSKVQNKFTYDEAAIDDLIESAIGKVQEEDEGVTGMVMSREMATALAKLTVDKAGKGIKRYPELAWGASPDSLNGLPIQITNNISYHDSKKVALLGDFANSFKWGYTKQIPMEVIKYGDPDNSGHDLKGYNQVYVRAEAYLGWGILNPKAFAIIEKTGSGVAA